MLSVKTTIKNLDFDSLIKFGLPIIKANPPEINTNPIIKKSVESLLKVKDSNILSILKLIPDSMKEFLAVKIITGSHDKIESFINAFAETQNLKFKIENISISKDIVDKSFDVSCVLSAIDYGSFVKKFLPAVHLDDAYKLNSFLNSLFEAMISEMDSTERLLSAISEKTKEELVCYFIEQNSDKLCQGLTKFIVEKGINLDIDSLFVENPSEPCELLEHKL